MTAAASWSASGVRDSLTVSAWTFVSRLSGVLRVAITAAVLGPTYFGNTYQTTNSLPYTIYYGLLGGSLLSSILVVEVPALRAGLLPRSRDNYRDEHLVAAARTATS